ncbi:MAG: hypothetical protein ACXVNQ_00905 [Bacteroidia bacterium]
MAPMLNKIIATLFVFYSITGLAQNQTTDNNKDVHNPNDYKDPVQFEKFGKRKNTIAAWQINQLKEGALVVRLKTNQKLFDALTTQGNNNMALEKEKEQYVINRNTYAAYKDYFKFCKVYFIYSNSSDTLMNGARTGIFLDSNLKVDPSITMNEKYYLLAERDYGYNSSIGFVKEDSARKVVETGNPVKEMAIVLKNKYGHQLKGPFPYEIKEKNFMDATYDIPMNVNKSNDGSVTFDYTVNKTYLADLKEKDKGKKITQKTTGNSIAKIKKQYTYEKLAESVDSLNDELNRFYQKNTKPDMERMDVSVKPFLY